MSAEVVEVAKSFLKQEHHHSIQHWLENASKNQLKGLRVIYAIVKHQNNKRFRPMKPNSKLSKSTKQLLLKQNIYSEDSSKPEFSPFSVILKPSAFRCLQDWADSNSDQHWQSLVLECLQGMHSVFKRYQTDNRTHSQSPELKLPRIQLKRALY